MSGVFRCRRCDESQPRGRDLPCLAARLQFSSQPSAAPPAPAAQSCHELPPVPWRYVPPLPRYRAVQDVGGLGHPRRDDDLLGLAARLRFSSQPSAAPPAPAAQSCHELPPVSWRCVPPIPRYRAVRGFARFAVLSSELLAFCRSFLVAPLAHVWLQNVPVVHWLRSIPVPAAWLSTQ